MLAALATLDWVLVHERRRKEAVLRASVDDLVPEPYHVPRQSAPRRKIKRLHRDTRAATSPVEAKVEDEANDINDLFLGEETVLGSGRGSGW